MKQNYYKPQQISSLWLLAVAIVAAGAVLAVESLQTSPADNDVGRKVAAATLAQRAMETIKHVKLEKGIEISPVTDPAQTGMVGRLMTSVTSNDGHLPSKQVTTNPNFAAAVVQMLQEADLEQGDVVAIGASGSFPAMNIHVLAAVETMKLQPVIISSASASQWGANDPELLWVDMERELVDRNVFRHHSVAASVGGVEDRGIGISKRGREILHDAIQRNELPFIEPANYLDSVNQRMALYEQHAAGRPIAAYINIGGGTTSVGTKVGQAKFRHGVNLTPPPGELAHDSVMARFSADGVPVIHISQIRRLAQQYGLPEVLTEMPAIGEGEVYSPRRYNRWLAGGLLLGILAALAALAHARRPIQTQDMPPTLGHNGHGHPAIAARISSEDYSPL